MGLVLPEHFCSWLSGFSAGMAFLALLSSFYVAYKSMKHRVLVDEMETQVMGLIDDALQLLIPSAVLNHIGNGDMANFEINRDFVATLEQSKQIAQCHEVVAYPCDISRQFSEKSQMYLDFGEPNNSKSAYQIVPETNEMINLAMDKSRDPTKGPVATPLPTGTTPLPTGTTPLPTVGTPLNGSARGKQSATNVVPKKLVSAAPTKSREALVKPSATKSKETLVKPSAAKSRETLVKPSAAMSREVVVKTPAKSMSKETMEKTKQNEKPITPNMVFNVHPLRKPSKELVLDHTAEEKTSVDGSPHRKKKHKTEGTLPD